mgnify:CR=1 FL=1
MKRHPPSALWTINFAPLCSVGDGEVLQLKPLASLQRLEEVSARGYYQYNLTGLPLSVKRLHLHVGARGSRIVCYWACKTAAITKHLPLTCLCMWSASLS